MKHIINLLCSARSMTAVLAILLTGCITYPAHAQPVRVDSSGLTVYPTNFWSTNAARYLAELVTRGVKTNAASASADGYLTSADWQAFNAKQAAIGYTPATNTLAGILAAMGYTPPTNSNAGITLALGFNAATNTLAGIAAALGYTPATNSNAGIVSALGFSPMPASLTLSNLMATGAFTNGLVAGTGITFTTNGTTGEITIASTAGAGGAADSLNPNPQLNGTWSTALGINYFAGAPTNVNGNLQLMAPSRMYFQATTPGAGLHTGGTFGFYSYAIWVTNTLNMVAGSTISGTAFMPEVGLSLSDNTTANASTVKHGFLPKLDGNSSHVLRGDGTWGASSGSQTPWTSDIDASGYSIFNGGTIEAGGFSGDLTGGVTSVAHGITLGGVTVEQVMTNTVNYMLTNDASTVVSFVDTNRTAISAPNLGGSDSADMKLVVWSTNGAIGTLSTGDGVTVDIGDASVTTTGTLTGSNGVFSGTISSTTMNINSLNVTNLSFSSNQLASASTVNLDGGAIQVTNITGNLLYTNVSNAGFGKTVLLQFDNTSGSDYTVTFTNSFIFAVLTNRTITVTNGQSAWAEVRRTTTNVVTLLNLLK